MKLDRVKILTQTFSQGVRHWWTADLFRDGNFCAEIQQAGKMSMTHDDALDEAKIFAMDIGAEFVAPVPRADPCL